MHTHSRRDFLGRIGGVSLLLVRLRRRPLHELASLSATALARRIREKKLSAVEAVRASIARIETVNPRLNAVVQTCFERALREAREADDLLAKGSPRGPLHGVPMTIKDSLDTEGVVTTGGTVGRLHYIPQKDATVVARLRKAGAILLGKTNTPEFTLAGGGIPGVNAAAKSSTGSRAIPTIRRARPRAAAAASAIVAAGGVPFDMARTGVAASAARRTPTALPASSRPPGVFPVPDTSSTTAAFTTPGSRWARLPAAWRICQCSCPSLPDLISAMPPSCPYRGPIRPRWTLEAARRVLPGQRSGGDTMETRQTVAHCAKFLEEEGCQVREDLPKDLMMEMEDIAPSDQRRRLDFVQRMADKWGTRPCRPFLVERNAQPAGRHSRVYRLLERQDDSRRKLLQWFTNYDVVLCPVAGKPAELINLGDDPLRRAPRP